MLVKGFGVNNAFSTRSGINSIGNRKTTRICTEALVNLYSKWNIAEPGKGYDTKATEWRSKLTPVLAESGKPDAKRDKR